MNLEQQIRDLHAKGTARSVATELLGLNRYSFADILETMGLTWPNKNAARVVEIDGIRDTIKRHAERIGIATETLRWRMSNGFEASAPKCRREITRADAERFVSLRKAGVPSWDAAQRIGRTYRSAHAAAIRFCPGYLELSAQTPRIRRTKAQLKGETQ